MTSPFTENQDFGPEHFSSWPATVPTERLERALQYVKDAITARPELILQPHLPASGDPALDMDMFLTAESMRSPFHGAATDLTPLDAASDEDFIPALFQILLSLETEHHFACATISTASGHPHSKEDTITITGIFTLAKHPDWMGLCIALPTLQALHIHAAESTLTPGAPAAAFAIPDSMHPEDIPSPPVPPHTGLQTLAEVAAWHGAASFNWLPIVH